MKLLVISDSYPPYHSGGYELRCKDVIDRLMHRGNIAEVITTRIPEDSEILCKDDKDILRILHSEDNSKRVLRRIFEDYQDLRHINRVINSFKPDIIYIWHAINLTRAIFPYLAEQKIPIVYDEGGVGLKWAWEHHGPWYTMIDYQSNSKLKRIIKDSLSSIVNFLSGNLIKKRFQWPVINAYFNSHLNLDNATQANVPLNKYQVIYSGIDLSEFPYKENQVLALPLKIISPGRFVPLKGIVDSVKLINELVKKKNIPAKLTLIGVARNISYLHEILELIKEKHLENDVEIIDFIKHDEMSKLYQSSDFCFFPSYHKSGFSRVPLEAMASGCLVLTYGNEGSNEVIRNRETGFIIPEGEYSVAADLIEELLRHPNLYIGIINSSRQEIEQKYDMDNYVNQIESFLLDS